MAIKIQLRRGTEAEFDASHGNAPIVPADGEVLVVQPSGTTGGYIVIGNGSDNWLQLKADADGRFYYMPGHSETQMGGVQPSGSTPLTVTGASGQSVPIFVVEDSNGFDIFKVSDDESSDGAALVAIESHGQTADVVLSVFGQLDQDDDNSGGDLLRVQPDAGQVGKGLAVDHSGNVSIVPVDDDGVTDTAFRVTASGNSDNPIMRVQEADGTDLFKIAQGSSVFVKTLNLGNTPNHADPSNFGVVRSATTPNNTDSGADATHHLDDPHFRAKVSGSGTSMIGEIELAGNSAAGASHKAITVAKNGTSGNLAEIDYAGNITAEGKATFADAEIDVTSRSTNAASVLRKDEIESTVAGTSGPFYYAVSKFTEFDVRNRTRLFPLVLGSAPHSFGLSVTGSDSPTLTILPIVGTSSDIETGYDGSNDDTTNGYIIKVPANSGSLAFRLQMESPNTGASGVFGTMSLRQYTAQELLSSDFEFEVCSTTIASASFTDIASSTAVIPNRTTDKFYAVSFAIGDIATGGAGDDLNVDVLVARSAGDFDAVDPANPTTSSSVFIRAT